MKAPDQIEFYRASLAVSPLLRTLAPESLDALARVARLIRFAPGERIFSREDLMTFSGVILCGGVRSSLTSLDGYELSTSILRRGSFFGILGLLEPTPAMWDCTAYGQTELVAVTNQDFRAEMQVHPDLALMLAKATNYRLRKAYAMMSNLVLETLERRLRRTLIMLAAATDEAGSGGIPEIAITQEALGHFVQCSRPSVNKALRDLQKQGLIDIAYGVIRLLDVPALKRDFEGETILVL